jgi:putative ABC transport system permease protein
MLLVGLLGLLAVVIVAAGVYGMLAWVVAQRTPEIGVRLALGARPAQVVRMILASVSVLLGIGLAIGLAGAWALTRFVESLLYGVRPHDPWLFTTAAIVVFGSGLLAALAPSRRAARVDPVTTLKGE